LIKLVLLSIPEKVADERLSYLTGYVLEIYVAFVALGISASALNPCLPVTTYKLVLL